MLQQRCNEFWKEKTFSNENDFLKMGNLNKLSKKQKTEKGKMNKKQKTIKW